MGDFHANHPVYGGNLKDFDLVQGARLALSGRFSQSGFVEPAAMDGRAGVDADEIIDGFAVLFLPPAEG